MGDTILLRRGTLDNLPDLQAGEPGWSEDSNQLYIGTTTGTSESAMPIGDYDWCPESFTQASIESALTSLGTTDLATLLLRPGAWAISSPLAIPANIILKMPPNAYFTYSATGAVTGLKYATPEMFGAKGDGTTDDTTAINNAIQSLADNGIMEFRPVTYAISDVGATEVALTVDKQCGIRFNGCTFSYGDDYNALLIGHAAGGVINEAWFDGHVRVMRTATIDHTGTETAASQLKGYGIKFRNVFCYIGKGSAYVNGFEVGYYFEGSGSGCTNVAMHNLQTQDCLIDYYFRPVDSANSYVSNIDIYSMYSTFDSTFYSDITGTAIVSGIKNNRTLDGINFWGGVCEYPKERKISWGGSWSSFNHLYYDPSNAGTDIEFLSGGNNNIIIGGSGLVYQAYVDAGNMNSIIDPAVLRIGIVPNTGSAQTAVRGIGGDGSASSMAGTVTLSAGTTTTDLNSSAITGYGERMVLDVAAGSGSSRWVAGETISGVTSGNSCKIITVVDTVDYKIFTIKDRNGAFTDGEELTNGTLAANQGAGYPQITPAVSVVLFPTTSNAASTVAATYVSAISAPPISGAAYGVATITHPNDANTDKTFYYQIISR